MRTDVNLDVQFQQDAAQLAVLATSQPRAAKLRVQAWLSKLREPTSNAVWKRNRNMYSALLLSQLQQGALEPPFTAMPPDGALPNLPHHLVYRALSPSHTAAQLRDRSPSPSPRHHLNVPPQQLQGLVQTFHSNMQARGFDLSRARAKAAPGSHAHSGGGQQLDNGVGPAGGAAHKHRNASVHERDITRRSGGGPAGAAGHSSGQLMGHTSDTAPASRGSTQARLGAAKAAGSGDSLAQQTWRDQERLPRTNLDGPRYTDDDYVWTDQVQDMAAAALVAAKEAEIAARVAAKRQQQQELEEQARAQERHKERTAQAKAHLDAVILRYNSARQHWTSPTATRMGARPGEDGSGASRLAWSPTKHGPRDEWARPPASPGALKLMLRPQERPAVTASGQRDFHQGQSHGRTFSGDTTAQTSLNDQFQPWGQASLRLTPPRRITNGPKFGAVGQDRGSPTRTNSEGWSPLQPPSQAFPVAHGYGASRGQGDEGAEAPVVASSTLRTSPRHFRTQRPAVHDEKSPTRSSPSSQFRSRSRSSSPGTSPTRKQWPSPDPALTYSVARKLRSSPLALQVLAKAPEGPGGEDAGDRSAVLVPRPLVARALRPARTPAKFEFSSLIPSLVPAGSGNAPEAADAAERVPNQSAFVPSAVPHEEVVAARDVRGQLRSQAAAAASPSHDARRGTSSPVAANDGFESPGSSGRSASPRREPLHPHRGSLNASNLSGHATVGSSLLDEPSQHSQAMLALRLTSPPSSPLLAAGAADGVPGQYQRSVSSVPSSAPSAVPSSDQRDLCRRSDSRSADRLRRGNPSSTSSWSRPSSVPPSSRTLSDPPAAPPTLPATAQHHPSAPPAQAAPLVQAGAVPDRPRTLLSRHSSVRSSLTEWTGVSTRSLPSSTQLTEMARRSLAASLPDAPPSTASAGSGGPPGRGGSSVRSHPPSSTSARTSAPGSRAQGEVSGVQNIGAADRDPAGGDISIGFASPERLPKSSGSVDLQPPGPDRSRQPMVQETPRLVRRPSTLTGSDRPSLPTDTSRRASSADARSGTTSLGPSRLGSFFASGSSSAAPSGVQRPGPTAMGAGGVAMGTGLRTSGSLSGLSGVETAVSELASLDVDNVIRDFERSLQDHLEFTLRPSPAHAEEQLHPFDPSRGAPPAPAQQQDQRGAPSSSSSLPSAASRLADRFALHSALSDFRLAFDRLKRRLALHSSDPAIAEALYSGAGAEQGGPVSRYRRQASPQPGRGGVGMPLPAWRPPGSAGRSLSVDSSFTGIHAGPSRAALASRAARSGRQTMTAERFRRVAADAVANYQDDVALLLSRVRTVLQPGAQPRTSRGTATRRDMDVRIRRQLEAVAREAAAETVRELDLRRGLVAEVLQTLEESAHQLGLQLVTLAAAPLDLPAPALAQLAAELRDHREGGGGSSVPSSTRPLSERPRSDTAWVRGRRRITDPTEHTTGSGRSSSHESGGVSGTTPAGSELLSSVGATAAWDSAEFELAALSHAGITTRRRDDTSDGLGDMPTPVGAPEPRRADTSSQRTTGPASRSTLHEGSVPSHMPDGGHGSVGAGDWSTGNLRSPLGTPTTGAGSPLSSGARLGQASVGSLAAHFVSPPVPTAAAAARIPDQVARRRAVPPPPQPSVRRVPASSLPPSSPASAPASHISSVPSSGMEQPGSAFMSGHAAEHALAAYLGEGELLDDWHAGAVALRLAQEANAAREAAQAAALEAAAAVERQAAQVSVLEAAVTALRDAAHSTSRDAAAAAAEREAAQAAAHDAAQAAAREAAQTSALEAAALAERQLAQVAVREASALEAAISAVREAAQATAREAAAAAAEREAAARDAAQVAAYEAAVAVERQAAQQAAREAAYERQAAQAAAIEAAHVAAQAAAQAAAREAAVAAAREAASVAREAAQEAATQAAVEAARQVTSATSREAAVLVAREAAQATAREAAMVAAARGAVEATAREAASAAAACEAAQAAAREAAVVAERQAALAAAREAVQMAALEAAVAAARDAATAARGAAQTAAEEAAGREAAQAAVFEEAVASAKQAVQDIAREAAAAAEREAAANAAREAAVAAAWEAAAAAERRAAQAAEREAAAAAALDAAVAAAREAAMAAAQEMAREAADAAARAAAAAAERDLAAAAAREAATVAAARGAAEAAAREAAASAAASEAAHMSAREAAAAAQRHAAHMAEREAALEATLATARETVLVTARELVQEAAREAAAASRETTRAAELLAAQAAEREAAQVGMLETAKATAREAAMATALEAAEMAERHIAEAATREAAAVAAAAGREVALAAVEEVTAATLRKAAAREAMADRARDAAVAAAREAAVEAAHEAALALAERQIAQAAAVAAEAASAVAVAQTSRLDASSLMSTPQRQPFAFALPPSPAGLQHYRTPLQAPAFEGPTVSPFPEAAGPSRAADPRHAGLLPTGELGQDSHQPAQQQEPVTPRGGLAYRALVWELPDNADGASVPLTAAGAALQDPSTAARAMQLSMPAPATEAEPGGSYAAAAAVAAIAAAMHASPPPQAPPLQATYTSADPGALAAQGFEPLVDQPPRDAGLHEAASRAYNPQLVLAHSKSDREAPGAPTSRSPQAAARLSSQPTDQFEPGPPASGHDTGQDQGQERQLATASAADAEVLAMARTAGATPVEPARRVGFLDIANSADLTLELFRTRRQELAASPPQRPRPASAATTPSQPVVREHIPASVGRPQAASRAPGPAPSEVLAAIRNAAAASAAALLDANARRDYHEFLQVKKQLGLIDSVPPPLQPPPPGDAPALGPPAPPRGDLPSGQRGGQQTEDVRPLRQPHSGMVPRDRDRSPERRAADSSLVLKDPREARELTLRLQRLADRTTQLQQRVVMMAKPARLKDQT